MLGWRKIRCARVVHSIDFQASTEAACGVRPHRRWCWTSTRRKKSPSPGHPKISWMLPERLTCRAGEWGESPNVWYRAPTWEELRREPSFVALPKPKEVVTALLHLGVMSS